MSHNPVLPDVVQLPHVRQLSDAVAAAPIGIVCVAATTGRYVFVNQTYAQMIGRTQAEVLASDPYEILVGATHPDDMEATRRSMEALARGEVDSYQCEKRLIAKNGATRWVAVHVVAARCAAGRLAFVTLYYTDVHERRAADAQRERLEDQLRNAQKLEALGRLAGGVAHDFNNRLVVIMGYAQLVKERLPAASPLVSHTERVIESASRAAELTQQLLAYGRHQVLDARVFDLNATVDNMRRVLERLLGAEVELETCTRAAHPHVLGDVGQIEQVIINLAINARDAMPHGGRLSLETENATVAASDSGALAAGEYVALVVRDSGVGIPTCVLPRIFEPFFTTKEVGHGTGLGLATVESIVQRSGGAIEVESQPGQGTTFTILLPSASASPVVEQALNQASAAHGANFETVLVCDTDDAVRELISNVLGLRGYLVLQARSAQHALEIAAAERGPIHLLVAELVMATRGGLELAAELRRRRPQLPVLFIAGHSARAALLTEQLEPNSVYLQKPFMPGDLTRTVCSMLERPAT
jgi:two-component system, cell cycle sensor histidine kinase and response regulator CckA